MDKYSCYMPQCPRRESCTLWHIAQQEIAEEYVFLSVTNPQLIEQAGAAIRNARSIMNGS